MIVINIQDMPTKGTATNSCLPSGICSNYYTVTLPNSMLLVCQEIPELKLLFLKWLTILCACICCVLLTSVLFGRRRWDRKLEWVIRRDTHHGHRRLGIVWKEVPSGITLPLCHWILRGTQVKGRIWGH